MNFNFLSFKKSIFPPLKKVIFESAKLEIFKKSKIQKTSTDSQNVVFERFRILADQQKKIESIPPRHFEDMAFSNFGVLASFSPFPDAVLTKNCKVKYLQLQGSLEALTLPLCSTIE